MTDALLELDIMAVASGGAGIARFGGRGIFVEGCMPGELVLCRIKEGEKATARGELLEVLRPSPERIRPECPFFGTCGGCDFQYMAYPAQMKAKTVILKDAIARIGGFESPEPEFIPSQPWEYRNRMQFHAIRHFEKDLPDAFCGLKGRKSDKIVPISDCPIADPGIRKLLSSDPEEAKRLLLSPEKDRITVYSRGNLLLSESGPSRGKTELAGKAVVLDAGVFFQSNGAMLERLVADLREIVVKLGERPRNRPMADLYCGVGTFTAFLGEFFPALDLVEENRTSLALARENLAAFKTVNFWPKRAEIWAKTNRLADYGLILADPPRQGLGNLADRLAESGPEVFAYVSCDPSSLARDGKILSRSYRMAELRLYDFYPQTAHIESLALFVRN
ncbi:MAG: methyltransferase [Treponema sp.]|nr:methyltransferase [Treponema sp.]